MAGVGPSNSRWIDPAHKRSHRITDESWERFKPILCTLYKSYTLNIVMEFMKRRFNFHASKRQYGYRLDKWGVKKYNSGEKKNSMGALEQMEFDNVRPFDTSPRLNLPSTIASTSAIVDDTDHDDYISTQPSPRHRIRYPWGPGDGEATRKLAADFCAAMSDDENAFQLYSGLSSSLSTSNQPHSATQMFLAISCARVADKPEDTRQAWELLSGLLSQQQQAYDDEPHFVMSMLKAYLEDRLEQVDNTTVKRRTCATIKKFVDENGSLRHLPHNYSSIDLVADYFLCYGLDQYERALCEEEKAPNFSAEHLLNDFIRRQPFVDMVRRNASQPLRLCVAWCNEQLHNNHPVPLQNPSVQPNPAMRHWWDNTRIFCTLWGVLLGLVRAGYAPDWYNQCESAYGISASELLVTVSWMIGAETTPRDYAMSDESLLKKAAERAQSLLELKESELLIEFIDKFEWMNELVDLVDEEKSFEPFLQSQLRQYLSETLRIQLPYPAQSQSQSQESTAPDMDHFDVFAFGGDLGFVNVNVDYSAPMPSPSAYGFVAVPER
ncbi:Clr5 domain-containing protein [Fusarium sp. Ph1]|nr:Clr5 domain-containing protein [Fusarium sp. Ph1]